MGVAPASPGPPPPPPSLFAFVPKCVHAVIIVNNISLQYILLIFQIRALKLTIFLLLLSGPCAVVTISGEGGAPKYGPKNAVGIRKICPKFDNHSIFFRRCHYIW